MTGCMACDLAAGRVPLPGGTIHETATGLHGPALQMAMFEADVPPDPRQVERVATVARERFVAAT